MFIKLYESALFLKYYNVKLHINTKYFGETLEEQDKLKTTGCPLSEPTIRSIEKKPVNEFVKTHLLAISLGFMSQTLYDIDKLFVIVITFYFIDKVVSFIFNVFNCFFGFTRSFIVLTFFF